MNTRDLLPRNWFKTRNHPIIKEDGTMISRFDRDIERIFEDFTRDIGNFESFLPSFFRSRADANLKILPRLDLSETDREYILEADLPGVKEQDLDISVSKDGILSIKGKRESKDEHKNRNYYTLERSFGSFDRSLTLPSHANIDKISATFFDSTLVIKMPKREPTAEEVKKIKLTK